MSAVSELRLRNQLAELQRLSEWISESARVNHWPQSLAHAVELALVEWVTNVISYAYPNSQEHWLTVRLESGASEVRAEVVDEGIAFNPLTHPPVDINAPLEQRAIGGLGVHMMRKLMDEVKYCRKDERNIVTMTKRRE
jgi:anti-sigma regulatory factor (Ser/Thr protein kinase)